MRIGRVAILLFLLLGACSDAPQGTDPGPAIDGYAAPDFKITTFEGPTFHLGEQAGTPVVLNFWESW